MSTLGILVTILLLAAAIFFIALPLMRAAGSRSREALARKARDEVVTAYERVLTVIRDLDEDYQTGKLTGDEYQEERARRVQEGAALLHQLELLDASSATQTTPEVAGPQAVDDSEIEALIARYAQQA